MVPREDPAELMMLLARGRAHAMSRDACRDGFVVRVFAGLNRPWSRGVGEVFVSTKATRVGVHGAPSSLVRGLQAVFDDANARAVKDAGRKRTDYNADRRHAANMGWV